MASARELVPGWHLEIELEDLGRRRTASLDFERRETVNAQLAQIAPLTNKPKFGQLLEFTNEAGDVLAVLASAYVSHVLRER
jgi:hypothetical protein